MSEPHDLTLEIPKDLQRRFGVMETRMDGFETELRDVRNELNSLTMINAGFGHLAPAQAWRV